MVNVQGSVRLLRRQPAFTLTALATIALAIAANTLIFALVRGILLRPLPLREPNQLVRIEELHRSGASNLTGATFADLRMRSRTVEAIAAFRTGPAAVSDQGHAVQASSSAVTADYFKVLGTAPVLGRLFDRTDFLGGSTPTVVISRALWQRLFNSDPTAIGRIILVNAARRQIVGVADVPASAPGASNLWLPYPEDAPLLRNRRAHLYTVVARVSPRVSIAAANAELEAIAVGLRPLGGDVSDVSFRASGLADRMVQPLRPALLVLRSSVLLLLTIGFANVANLLLVQGSVRARELSIRTALGAGRVRLMRQLIIESLVLGAVGGALGSALGIWSVPVVRRFLPPSLPRVTEVTADPILPVFGIGLSIACAVAFGLLPALRASIRDPMDALRSRDMEARPSRTRDVLVAAEVALTLILLVGAGLLGRSLLSVSRVPLGFDPRSLVTIDLSLPSGKYNDAAAHRQFTSARSIASGNFRMLPARASPARCP
jgi:putative ABC transport system permease protein